MGITLTADCDHIDLIWYESKDNDDATSANIEMYLDNFKATHITPSGDILQGYGFEEEGNMGYFVGQGNPADDVVIQRVKYSELSIGAPEKGDTYALKMSHPSNLWPKFHMDFGTTLQAGTEISFDVYIKINENTSNNYCQLEFWGSNSFQNQIAVNSIRCGQWNRITMVLPAGQDYAELFWNVDVAGISDGAASSEVYVDNVIAKDPDAPVGDILEGYGFEVAGNERFFFITLQFKPVFL